MRIIKVIILLFVGSCLQTIARDFKEQSDSEPLKAPAVQWIGAITRSDVLFLAESLKARQKSYGMPLIACHVVASLLVSPSKYASPFKKQR